MKNPSGLEGDEPSFLVGERSLPYLIIVDGQGERFANESESYVDLGHHMVRHDGDGAYWLVADARHARRYLGSYAMDPRVTKAMTAQGLSAKAGSIGELATSVGLDPVRPVATVDRFNCLARAGIDSDFGRGTRPTTGPTATRLSTQTPTSARSRRAHSPR